MAALLSQQPWKRGYRVGPLRVGSTSWQDGEAAVRRRLTLKRQVTTTLLPDCSIKPPAAEAEEFAFSLRSERPLRSETCLAASEAASVSSGSGCDRHLTRFVAGKPPLEVRFPQAAARRRVLSTLTCLMMLERSKSAF